ncbi:hypothetical protein HMSSN036_19380 [Paenibacillus macerans]|nr:hypothetical protein HMSSN036_19380 [Paenibacillus macerans]
MGALLLAAALAFGLAGCGGGNAGNAGSSKPDAAGNFNKEGLPIVGEPVTLKVLTMRWGNMGDTFTQNQWLKDLETNTNVKIEWQVVSSNDWGEQKSIMLASGSLPDIILGDQTFSDSDIVNNLSYFRPLDDYIDQYMPNLKAAMEETPELKKSARSRTAKFTPCRPGCLRARKRKTSRSSTKPGSTNWGCRFPIRSTIFTTC